FTVDALNTTSDLLLPVSVLTFENLLPHFEDQILVHDGLAFISANLLGQSSIVIEQVPSGLLTVPQIIDSEAFPTQALKHFGVPLDLLCSVHDITQLPQWPSCSDNLL